MLKTMLDMDGCVHDFVGACRRILAPHAPNDYVRWHTLNTPPRVWSFWKDWGWSSADAVEILNQNVYELFSGPMNIEARIMVRWLEANTDLTVATTPWGFETDVCKQAKEDFFEQHLGFVPKMLYAEDKASDWDVVIEDHPGNLAVNKDAELILVQHPYNYDGSSEWVEAGLDYKDVTSVPFFDLTQIIPSVEKAAAERGLILPCPTAG